LDIEYEAFQISSAVMDDFIDGDELETDLPFGILAFGIYDSAGKSLRKSEELPDLLSDEDRGHDSFTISGGRLKLVRRLGQAGMGRMLGSGRRAGEERGDPEKAPIGQNRRSMQNPMQAPMDGSLPGALRRDGLSLYIELPSGDFERREFLFAIAFFIGLAAVSGLYFLVLMLYRRNLVFADREERTRELIQLGEAARTIAHEIKNPLSIIQLQCATLAKLLPAERSRNLDIIMDESGRLNALTDTIGDFLRSDRGNPETLEAGAWIADFAERNALPLSLEIKGNPRVLIDPRRLESMLGNLAKNAREASGGGGSVEMRAWNQGPRVHIEVLDRGPGIGPDVAEQMFRPFFTTKARGSGIGLSLARKFAQEAGGSLDYKKREGGGSVFSLLLPSVP
jgi:signal transduction histidine kinase